MATISEALAIAIQHHQAGRLQAAEQIYRQILAMEPNHADTLHLLGVLAHQVGRHEVAVEYLGRAIGLNSTEAAFHNNLGAAYLALRRMSEAIACYPPGTGTAQPDDAQTHHNLGIAFREQGKIDEAVACYRRALELKPDYAEALSNLGNALNDQGKLDEAVACYRRALELEPDFAAAHYNLGNALKDQGKFDEAIACCSRALELKPDFAQAHNILGNLAKEQGKLDEAVACYHRALELKPDFAQAHYNLGNVAMEQGKLDEAVACYHRALELEPDYADAHYNLGNVAKERGKFDEAIVCYRRALDLRPDYAQAHNNLGNTLKSQGKLDEAVACYQRALERKPDFAEAHNNLGVVFREQGKLDEALACCRRALELEPDYAEAHNNLGVVFREQGKLDEAVACYHRALELEPDYALAHYNLGNALKDQGKLDEAVARHHRALELKPDFPQTHNDLGNALNDQGKLDEAIACYRRALELKPDYPEAHNNLGNTLKGQGKLDEAVACYQRALELKPDFAEVHSNLLYTRIFCPGCDAPTLYEEHLRWNHRHATPLAKFILPHLNDRCPDRRLRVGYVSPDFRNHVVGRNLLPLFREHDHQRFEIVCYADVPCHDEITARFAGHADAWRDATGLTDDRLARRIREDRIDILVDLTLHMAHNRLLVFARKPAPVQATFGGYPGTTGLSTIDYRLTDPYLDPPGLYDRYYSEESIRLPDSFWCYDPLDSEPAVNALPVAEKGYISFGCLNNFCKVNPRVLKIWARVLKAVDRSRLMILAGEGTHRQHALDLLAEEGVVRDRVTFVASRPRQEYLKHYHGIDIGLDTVPYNGHTTSLDSFWMGVPVVTLVGSTVVGRAGLCQLMNLGLPELIASSPEQYARLAVKLAGDLSRLRELRATLRGRMRKSPLMDAPRFARNIEAAYRDMWRRWCATM